MSDDPKKKGRQDRSRINTSEDYEVRYWSKKFGRLAGQVESSGQKSRQLGCRRAARARVRTQPGRQAR